MGNAPNLLIHLMLIKSEKSSPSKEHNDFRELRQVQSDSRNDLESEPESIDTDLAEEG